MVAGVDLTWPAPVLDWRALNPPPPAPPDTLRLDKWLWAVRAYRTRSLAGDACRAGSVAVNALPAKPSREVRAGETITLQLGLMVRTLRVLGVPRARVGAKLVAGFCTDLTPPEEWEKARERSVQQVLSREKGSGRPTKRDRRLLDRLFE